MTCPKCQGDMREHDRSHVTVLQCDECESVFLDRTELGALIDEEQTWHEARAGHHTQPLPRITEDMHRPPVAQARARSFVDLLFGG